MTSRRNRQQAAVRSQVPELHNELDLPRLECLQITVQQHLLLCTRLPALQQQQHPLPLLHVRRLKPPLHQHQVQQQVLQLGKYERHQRLPIMILQLFPGQSRPEEEPFQRSGWRLGLLVLLINFHKLDLESDRYRASDPIQLLLVLFLEQRLLTPSSRRCITRRA